MIPSSHQNTCSIFRRLRKHRQIHLRRWRRWRRWRARQSDVAVFNCTFERGRRPTATPELEVFLFVQFIFHCVIVGDAVPRRRGFTIAFGSGRPLMMMDAAVVENHCIVPGDIPTSDLGPH